MKEKINNKFIKMVLAIQFVLLVFLMFQIFVKDKNSVPDRYSDYISLIELALDSTIVYKEELLDSTRLITIQQYPFIERDAFYDSKNNRYYHNLRLFRASDINNIAFSELNYSLNHDTVSTYFIVGHRITITVEAYRNNPHDDWKISFISNVDNY